MKILALIPARSGSKRLLNKNILSFAGKPLIAWSIDAALKCGLFADVVVSTDSPEIAAIAKQYHAQVPFLRPSNLSDDFASSYLVAEHALTYLSDQSKKNYDYLCFLQPTSPLRDSNDLLNAFKHLEEKNADAVISVCKTDFPPQLCNTLKDDLSLKDFFAKENEEKRTQDFAPYYRPSGAIYITKVSRFLEEKTFILNDKTFAYIMPRERSMDIDDEWDMTIAEALLMKRLKLNV